MAPVRCRGKLPLTRHGGLVTGSSPDGAEKFTLFYSEADPFSNFYPAPFEVDGNLFRCTEQYFHYMKAVVFNDVLMATRILDADIPSKQKNFGRKVRNFDGRIWNQVCKRHMKDACLAKFKQNKELKKQLLSTEGTTIVEAAPRDRKWGIGLGKDNPQCFDRKKWRGENLLGKILMEVRDELISSKEKEEVEENQGEEQLQKNRIKENPEENKGENKALCLQMLKQYRV